MTAVVGNTLLPNQAHSVESFGIAQGNMSRSNLTGHCFEDSVEGGLVHKYAELPVGSSTDIDSEPPPADTSDLDLTGDSDRLVIAEDLNISKDREALDTSESTCRTPSKRSLPEECHKGNRVGQKKTPSPTLSEGVMSSKGRLFEGDALCDEPTSRRMPIKKHKNETVDSTATGLNNCEDLDKNLNAKNALNVAETVISPPIQESKSVPPSGPPHALVNSFVAQAMKLWYDEELPKTMTSPSKELGKFIHEAKQRGLMMDKYKLVQLADTMSDVKNKKTNDDHLKCPIVSKIASPNVKRYKCDLNHSGIAPDDQYYSAPSPTTPIEAKFRIETENSTPAKENENLPPVPTATVSLPVQSLQIQSHPFSKAISSETDSPDTGNQKIYFCEPCNKSFTFRTNLTRHQRTFHGRPCRRRTKDGTIKDDSDLRSEHSFSSEDADHQTLDKKSTQDERYTPHSENVCDSGSNYGRFSPSVVSEANVGQSSPSMPSISASEVTPHKNILPLYMAESSTDQEYSVVTPKEKVPCCSLCLTTFGSPSQLAKHEPTCRGVVRSKPAPVDPSGAIDLSKPKLAKKEEGGAHRITSAVNQSYKPKFHYSVADTQSNTTALPTSSLTVAPFLPNKAALHKMSALISQSPAQTNSASYLENAMTKMTSGTYPSHPSDVRPSGSKPYHCSSCTKKFSSSKSLTKHATYAHKMSLPVVAYQSEIGNTNSVIAMASNEMKMLSKHDATGLILTSDVLGHYPCKMCGLFLPTSSHLRVHVQTNHLGLADYGARCDTSSPDSAKTNLKATEWVCHICQQSFASKRNLYRHLSHVHKVDPKSKPPPNPQERGPSTLVAQHFSSPRALVPNVSLTESEFGPSAPSSDIKQAALLQCEASENPTPGDSSSSSMQHLKSVVDRVLALGENQSSFSRIKNLVPPQDTVHAVKLPPKKAIMEEYKLEQEQERERDLQEGRAKAQGIPLAPHSSVLNLSQRKKIEQNYKNLEKCERKDSAIDLSAGKSPNDIPGQVSNFQNDIFTNGLLGEGKYISCENEQKRDHPVSPFTAIMNLSQSYIRRLLSETPIPHQQPHSESYSFLSAKDKENSLSSEKYSGVPHDRPGVFPEYDFHQATATKLREMITNRNKNLCMKDTDCHTSNPPSSGCSSSIDTCNPPFDLRRPLNVTCENQQDLLSFRSSGVGSSDISRSDTENVAVQKFQSSRSTGTENLSHRKQKAQKRKSMESSPSKLKSVYVNDWPEPVNKKVKKNSQLPLSDMSIELPSVKTGEYPAIAVGKRHMCGLCGASFTFQTNLTRHQRKLHGKPFVRKSSVGQKVEEFGLREESLSLLPHDKGFSPLSMIQQEPK